MTRFDSRYVLRIGGAALVASLLFIVPVRADDAAIREQIVQRLTKSHLVDRGQIDVSVQNGTAILSGFTLTVDDQRAAEKAARKETKQVENRLRVVPGEKKADADVRKAVVNAILREPYYGVFDSVGVAVEGGVVLLNGSVNQPWRKTDLDRRVAEVKGVRQIDNQITVQPNSINDDRLRVQLYRRIYGNTLFERYASFPDPPIRIIVENGNVTLTGVVNSRVEQAVLGSIARQTLSFKVENLVQVESEMKKEAAGKASI